MTNLLNLTNHKDTQKNIDYVIVGELGAPYGIKGWLKINSFTQPRGNLLSYTPWYIAQNLNNTINSNNKNPSWVLIDVTERREQGNKIIIKISGCNDPEYARLYTGKKIAVERTILPVLEKNSYYWRELEGLTVINRQGYLLGIVSYLMETGANDILVIKEKETQKEQAIPYLVGSVIVAVDLERQTITVDWEFI